MTNKLMNERVSFHQTPKILRHNNPTFASSSINDSLTIFTPQKQEHGGSVRMSVYKSSFEGKDKINTLGMGVYQQPNYARYSRDIFDNKMKANFSQHAASILSNNNSSEWGCKKQ